MTLESTFLHVQACLCGILHRTPHCFLRCSMSTDSSAILSMAALLLITILCRHLPAILTAASVLSPCNHQNFFVLQYCISCHCFFPFSLPKFTQVLSKWTELNFLHLHSLCCCLLFHLHVL